MPPHAALHVLTTSLLLALTASPDGYQYAADVMKNAAPVSSAACLPPVPSHRSAAGR